MARGRKGSNTYKKRSITTCDVEDCPDKGRDFGSTLFLATHMYTKHGIYDDYYKELLPANLKEPTLIKRKKKMADTKKDSVKQEQKPVENNNKASSNTDLSALESKIDNLTNLIPPNLCEEFPHLCSLKDKVMGIEGKIEELQEKIPKKITVNIPKQTLPEFPKPEVKVDINALADSIKEKLDSSMSVDVSGIKDTLDYKLDKITDILSQGLTRPESKEEVKEILEEVVKEEEKGHQNAQDYFDCPECRKQLLHALESRINDNTDDADINTFIKNIKNNIQISEGEGNGKTNTGPDKNTTEPSAERSQSDKGIERGSNNSGPNEIHKQDTTGENAPGSGEKGTTKESTNNNSISKSGSNEPKCTGGWCLLRRNSK